MVIKLGNWISTTAVWSQNRNQGVLPDLSIYGLSADAEKVDDLL